MFDSLVNWKNRRVSGAGESSRRHNPLQIADDPLVAVGVQEYAIHEIGSGKMQSVFRNGFALVF